jgi:hypothetical protein
MLSRNKLIKKELISENSYNGLFNYLSLHPIDDPEFHIHLKKVLMGFYSQGYPKLSSMKTRNDKCWFINSGMVIGVVISKRKKVMVVIFKAGEIAILPDSFFYGALPSCYFIACPDTHLLEITTSAMDEVFKLFPDAHELSNKIVAANHKKFMEKGELCALSGKEAVIEFYERHPEVKGADAQIKLLNACLATYLGITEYTLCKLLKQIYGDEP